MTSLRRRLSAFVAIPFCVTGCGGSIASPPVAVGSKPLVIETVSSEEGNRSTTHGADCVTFRASEGGPSTRICGDPSSGDETAMMVPYFGEQQFAHPTDASTVLVIGWSSLGGGMQTMHAWILRVEPKVAPVVIAKLGWTTDRGSAGFAVERSEHELRIGIRPPAEGEMIHEPGDWQLEVGPSRRDLEAVRKLPSAVGKGPQPRVAMPIHFDRWPAGTRFAWFGVTRAGFREPERMR